MALDKEYFDAIHIDVVRKKYYNANKVEAVFADIRRQAEALNEENARMRQQLAELGDRKIEMGDAVLSAQAVYQGIVEKANARAAAILDEAERRRGEMLREAQRQQDYAVERAEKCFNELKAQQQSAMEGINAAWQAFLCGLYDDEGRAPACLPDGSKAALPPSRESEQPERVPGDLSDKINAIARQLHAMDEE